MKKLFRCISILLLICCTGCATTDQLRRTFQPGDQPTKATNEIPIITVLQVGSVVAPDDYYRGRSSTWIGDAKVDRDYDREAIVAFARQKGANHIIVYEPIKDYSPTWWPTLSVVVRFEQPDEPSERSLLRLESDTESTNSSTIPYDEMLRSNLPEWPDLPSGPNNRNGSD